MQSTNHRRKVSSESITDSPDADSEGRPSPARPAAYYNSTDDDGDDEGSTLHLLPEEDSLIAKHGPRSPGLAERGGRVNRVEQDAKQASSLRKLFIVLFILVVFSAAIGIGAAKVYRGNNSRGLGQKHLSMDHVFNGTFEADKTAVHWIPEAGDGVYSVADEDNIVLVDLKQNTTRILVKKDDVKDEHGEPLKWGKWRPSANMKQILIQADRKKQWRHSSFGNYYIHNIDNHHTHPIMPPTDPPVTAYATWAPSGDAIAYVASNDLYILPSSAPSTSPIRVTTSGNASLFHGVPDWVYEEEVLAGDFALWWAPDARKVAFLRLDETLVDEYTFPIYNPTDNASTVVPYTTDVVMKYPKPGYDNPLVSVHVFDLDRYLTSSTKAATVGFPAEHATLELAWEGHHDREDSVITEVAWVSNHSLILKEVNRNADNGSVVLFDLSPSSLSSSFSSASASNPGSATLSHRGRVVRHLGRHGEQGDEGWIDHDQRITPVPAHLGGGYLDIVPSPDGFDHIALFSPADSGTPRFLTSGPWEVTSGILAVDAVRGVAYFQAAPEKRPGERHVYSVPIPTTQAAVVGAPTPMTVVAKAGWYEANFSPQGGFYLLSYDGPKIPWQEIQQVGDSTFGRVVTDNQALNVTDSQFETANVLFSEIQSDGYSLSVREIRPPMMDESGKTKYPVLFYVYGGPGSQLVDIKYDRSWHHYLACTLNYIVVTVDGRGTGFKGRKLRNPVKGNLGFFETKDQINAAKIWATKNYVDSKRIGIWGWSYGGFMSSKVVEADAGVHSLAMAVAPVTSWRLYDSIYTERYLNLPDLNPGGYINASITNVTSFAKVDYLLMHGSGDDNVHFANSAHLLDMLTSAHVRNFRFRMFTDSDHSIRRRGANREVYEYLTAFLVEKWGKGAKRWVTEW